MNTISIHNDLKILWRISGHDHYGFAENKQLYNLKTGRQIKQTINGRSIGYWVDRKFHTLSTLRPMLRKYIPEYCPF